MIDPGLPAEVVQLALEHGASDAECTLLEGDEFTARVRLGSLETLKEAGSRAVGVRVLMGQRAGSAYTSDASPEGLRRMVESALELARISTPDPHAGLPDPEELGSIGGDLALDSADLRTLDNQVKIEQATIAEQAALAADPRIVNSEGASFNSYAGNRGFANSRGFAGSYRTASCALSVTAVAKENGRLERDYWHSPARSYARLEPAAAVGRKAAERTLRRLGARKIPTCRVPVVFEPRTARTLLGHLFEAVSGDSVYRNASFLAGRMGETVAASGVTIIDDGTMPGLFGSSPFDDEGVPSRRTVVIERGVLRSWLLNTYTARKLGMKTTGNASRGMAGNAGIGHGNFFLQPGEKTEEQIVRGIPRGLYVTELIGFGVNVVTGDYSRGAAGLWIENGEFAYPVSEITIAANLLDMLKNVAAVASELDFRGSVAAPALVIGEMTVSGQ